MEGGMEIDGAAVAVPAQHERIFYRPDRQRYTPRARIVNDGDCAALTDAWPLSDAFRAGKGEVGKAAAGSALPGSVLENNFAWQKKWYLRFEPPKSAEELGIGEYWRYDGPRLLHFIAGGGGEKLSAADAPQLTQTPLPTLKAMATKVLSGMPSESMTRHAYQKSHDGRGSVVNDRDAAASTVSSQLRMPESQGGTKRSILASFTSAVRGKSKGKPGK